MSIHMKVFPLDVGGWGHKIRYNTTVTQGASGHESRNANWQDSLRGFDAKYAVKTKADVDELINFFHTVRGQETSFLVKDYMDYKVSGSSIVLYDAAEPAQTQFQLYKYYDDAHGNTVRRDILFPKRGTVFLTVNGNLVDEADYTVSDVDPDAIGVTTPSTGIVTFDTAPGAGAVILASFEFYSLARFATDEFDAEAFHQWVAEGAVEHFRITLPDIPLVEVRG